MKFSDQIRRAIETSGLTRYRLAQEAEVDQASLSRFMAGGDITTRTIDAIAEVLRLKVQMTGPRKSVLRKDRR